MRRGGEAGFLAFGGFGQVNDDAEHSPVFFLDPGFVGFAFGGRMGRDQFGVAWIAGFEAAFLAGRGCRGALRRAAPSVALAGAFSDAVALAA